VRGLRLPGVRLRAQRDHENSCEALHGVFNPTGNSDLSLL
jgi:hypothetical protein